MKKRNAKAKILTSAMAVVLAVGLFPAAALAETGEQPESGETAVVSDYDADESGDVAEKTDEKAGISLAVRGDMGNGDNSGSSGNGENGGKGDGGTDDGHGGDEGGRGDAGTGGDEGGRGEGGTGGGHGGAGGGHGGGSTVSDSVLTVPSGLSNGVYSGTATVSADEDEDFTNYTIRVSAQIEDGAIANIFISGAGGNNLAYSNDALEGILRQAEGLTAGEKEIDTVSGATCSSKAIVQGLNTALQGEASITTYSVNNGSSNVTYLPEGSKFEVTITNPVDGVNYADIKLTYGVGKFAGDLQVGNDYTVNRISQTDTKVTYQITINPDSKYVIQDDDLIHSELYNEPGRQLSLSVANQGLGTIYIKSVAELSITNNTISMTGGNGETLADYYALLSDVTVQYKNENGEEVSKTYSTRWQHDMEAAFTGAELFNEDGSINFDVAAMVTMQGEDFEAVKDENGENVTYTEKVFPYGADGDYYITLSAGGAYDEISAWVGASYAGSKNDNSNIEDTKTNAGDNSANSPAGSNAGSSSAPAKSGSTSAKNTSSVKTADSSNAGGWTFMAAAFGSLAAVAAAMKKRKTVR